MYLGSFALRTKIAIVVSLNLNHSDIARIPG